MVERVCKEEGLQYRTEANEGRMYVDLTGGNVQGPSSYQQQPAQYDQSQYGQPHYQTAYPMGGQPQYGAWSQGGQQQQQQQQGGQQQQFDYEGMARKNLPKIIQLLRGCCTVM